MHKIAAQMLKMEFQKPKIRLQDAQNRIPMANPWFIKGIYFGQTSKQKTQEIEQNPCDYTQVFISKLS